MKKTKALLCLPPLLVGLFTLGCTSVQERAIKLSVPYVAQNPEACGAATLSMLFRYYGIAVPLFEVEESLFVPVLQGTTPELIADFSTEKGLVMQRSAGNWLFLVDKLKQGVPSIVFFGPEDAEDAGHFAVVTGINRAQDRIRLHNGALQNRWMLQARFMELWERGRYTVLWPKRPQDVGVDLP